LPARKVFEGIVYVLRTGCQWKALPKEEFGSASAIHKYFLQWEIPLMPLMRNSGICGKVFRQL
jgi:transposase